MFFFLSHHPQIFLCRRKNFLSMCSFVLGRKEEKIFNSPHTLPNFFPDFVKLSCFVHAFCDFLSPHTLTMMHLCITQCTYWTPLPMLMVDPYFSPLHYLT